jgi:hypothetical protein
MNWLLWRQHRSQAVITAVAIGVFGVILLITGIHMADDYRQAAHVCPGGGPCELIGNIFHGDGAIVDLVHLSILVPVLLGVFVGATLVAREVEQSTNVLVWTQTVTRKRWLLSKFAAAVAATAAVSAAVSLLVTWWSKTPNTLYGNRFEGAQFDTQNILPIAFTVFAVSLGIAAGCVLRRTLPAIAATIGLYVGVRLLVSVYLRQHYLASTTASSPLSGGPAVPTGSWTMTSKIVDSTGRTLSGRIPIPATCRAGPDVQTVTSCLSRLGYRTVATFQPPSHYWPFQAIEAGLYIALAAPLLVFAYFFTMRRDA